MLQAHFSTEMLQARRGQHNVFKVRKWENLQPYLVCSVRLSCRIGERSFQMSKKLKEYSDTKPILKEIWSS